MKKLRLRVVFGLIAFLGMTCSTDAADEPFADAEIIKKLVEEHNLSLFETDEGKILDVLWNSPQLIVIINGTQTLGFQTTQELVRKRNAEVQPFAPKPMMTNDSVEMRPLSSILVYTTISWTSRFKGVATTGVSTYLFRKMDDGWKVIHLHVGRKPK
jgi:hypothetical protein